MSWNEPSYRRFEQHHEEIAFSTFSKQPQPIIAQAEQSWIPQSQAHPTHRSRSLWTLVNEWRWEFLTWLLGVCALGSIAALLVIYGDRPLREWTPHIRPAPVVAALSQLAQSALLFSVSSCIGQLKWDWLHRTRSASDLKVFEEASRGPKGSLMLLPKTRL
jgi:anti-sigma-K factor RskA